jgi:hypothetical protein
MPTHVAHRRQYERRDVDIPVQITIGESCADQIAPVNGNSFPARVTNISGGGAHATVSTFLPRGARVLVDFPAGHGLPAGRVPICVMAVNMVDREPHYGLGLRFEDTECEVVQALRGPAWQERDA